MNTIARSDKRRIEWIDFVKGIAMMIVLYEHTDAWYRRICMFVSPVAMPLYFIISGFTVGDPTGTPFSIYFRKRCKRLLLPYVVYQVSLVSVNTIYEAITKTGGVGDFIRHCIGILYGRYLVYNTVSIYGPTNIKLLDAMNATLWFLPAMFLASLLYYLFFYVRKNHPGWKYTVLIVYIIVSIACFFLPVLLPWSMDTCGLLAVFMIGGYYIRKIENRIASAVGISCGVMYLIVCYINFGENTSVRKFGNPEFGCGAIPLYLLMGFAGTIALIWFSKAVYNCHKLKDLKMSRFFAWVGNKSLTFMCVQFVFINITHDIVANFVENRFVVGGIQFFVALVGCSVVSLAFEREQRRKKDSITKYL